MTPRSFFRLMGGLATVSLLVACSSSDSPTPSPSTAGTAGTASNAGSGGGGAGSLGGAAGSVATGGGGTGTAGVAGSGAGAGGATGGSGGATGGSGGAAGGAGGSGAVACPADKTFCSGFEEAALPAGAVYKANAAMGEWTRDFEVDTTVFHSGKSSLRVKASTEAGTSGSAFQMLAVTAPMAKFWARFYLRQADLDIGGVGHNAFAGATGEAMADNPNAALVQFAEDVGIAFNANDVVRWPMGFGRVEGAEKPFTLAKGMWHCIEISYDSEAREQKLYVNGTLQIDATDYPTSVASFTTFKFGFNSFHGPARAVWYDDVAVGPTRPGCL